MIKYVGYDIVFQEIPNEISLALNISNCPCHCKGCHSSYLAEDLGSEVTTDEIDKLVSENKGITCILFMGGDSDPESLSNLCKYIKTTYNIKTAWYSGRTYYNEKLKDIILPVDNRWFDYIKLGPYIEELGPLNNPKTNQRLYLNTGLSSSTYQLIGWKDITELFWIK